MVFNYTQNKERMEEIRKVLNNYIDRKLNEEV